ncbi:hypothetical protein J3Q64DRAFT_1756571 [Phycomyces blakesleeanus]
MPSTTRDGRRLTGYNGDETTYGSVDSHSLYDDAMDDDNEPLHGHIHNNNNNNHTNTQKSKQKHSNHDDDDDDDDDEEDAYGIEDAEEDDHIDDHIDDVEDEEDVESILSIPDPNIDFDLVYTLHTFAATVEGQASVVKGDALTLLDDTNSYWWLIKVLKTAEIGYIPAEHIETPYERLARLNSHRNIELTRRDIQDAFPAPPSSKPTSTKKVTLSKGVKFQAQVIIGLSDDEDFEEEFEEWHETMVSSESSSEESSDDDDDDDYEYMEERQMYGIEDYQEGSLTLDHFPDDPSSLATIAPSLVSDRRMSEGSIIDIRPVESPQASVRAPLTFDDTIASEADTIRISLTPNIARGTTEETSPVDAGGDKPRRNTIDQLMSSIAADIDLDADTESSSIGKPRERKERNSLRKFFSRGKDKDKDKEKDKDKNKKNRQSSDSVLDNASLNSQSTGGYSERERPTSIAYSDRERPMSMDSTRRDSEDAQLQHQTVQTALTIYAGTIPSEMDSLILRATATTMASELVEQAVQDFVTHGEMPEQEGVEYFLTVKGIDGDVYTLLPSDKPLAIYHTLTAHLSTPMPSLKKARRISQLMSTTDSMPHMGRPKDGAADPEPVRFYLNAKLRREEKSTSINGGGGLVKIKVCLLSSETSQTNIFFKPDQNRLDKLVSVGPWMLVSEVTTLLLEKFYILNGVVSSQDMDEAVNSLRLQGEGPAVLYRLAMCQNGQEQLLSPEDSIQAVFGDRLPPLSTRRSSSSNPDRSSISSMSSTIYAPQQDEVFFLLRRAGSVAPAETKPARPPRPIRQDTPMPNRDDTPTTLVTPMPNRALTSSPVDSLLADLHPLQTQQSQIQQSQPQQPKPDQRAIRKDIDSMIFCDDFGMEDMMMMIRGAVRYEDETQKRSSRGTSAPLRTEILEVYKEHQERLEQLEEALDQLMAEAVEVYAC